MERYQEMIEVLLSEARRREAKALMRDVEFPDAWVRTAELIREAAIIISRLELAPYSGDKGGTA